MTGTYILFGGVAGGIFFREYAVLHLGLAGVAGWPLYILGMLLVLLGLALIAIASTEMEELLAEDETSAEARDDVTPLDPAMADDEAALALDDALTSPRQPSLLNRVKNLSVLTEESALEVRSVSASRQSTGRGGASAGYTTPASHPTPAGRGVPPTPRPTPQRTPVSGGGTKGDSEGERRQVSPASRKDVMRVQQLARREVSISRVLTHEASQCSSAMPTPVAGWMSRRNFVELHRSLSSLAAHNSPTASLIETNPRLHAVLHNLELTPPPGSPRRTPSCPLSPRVASTSKLASKPSSSKASSGLPSSQKLSSSASSASSTRKAKRGFGSRTSPAASPSPAASGPPSSGPPSSVPDAPKLAKSGTWEVNLEADKWVAYDAPTQAALEGAYASGKAATTVTVRGVAYQVALQGAEPSPQSQPYPEPQPQPYT